MLGEIKYFVTFRGNKELRYLLMNAGVIVSTVHKTSEFPMPGSCSQGQNLLYRTRRE